MDNNSPAKKIFCTTREAAKILGVSLRTAQLWTESGLLEAWKTKGGHRRISRKSIGLLLFNPELPAEANLTRWIADSVINAAAPNVLNIMVVEDDPALRQLYEYNLRGWPMLPNVITVSDGYEALIRMGLVKPDILIADLHMPGMDGFKMLNTICSVPEFSDTAIIVVSGLDQAEIANRGGVPEGIPVLPKPIPFDQLQSFTESVIAKRHARQKKAN